MAVSVWIKWGRSILAKRKPRGERCSPNGGQNSPPGRALVPNNRDYRLPMSLDALLAQISQTARTEALQETNLRPAVSAAFLYAGSTTPSRNSSK